MSCCSCRARGAIAEEEAGAGSDSVVVAEGVVEGLLLPLPVGVLGSATFFGEESCVGGWVRGMGGWGGEPLPLGPERVTVHTQTVHARIRICVW